MTQAEYAIQEQIAYHKAEIKRHTEHNEMLKVLKEKYPHNPNLGKDFESGETTIRIHKNALANLKFLINSQYGVQK